MERFKKARPARTIPPCMRGLEYVMPERHRDDLAVCWPEHGMVQAREREMLEETGQPGKST